jgi:hypothetical protein
LFKLGARKWRGTLQGVACVCVIGTAALAAPSALASHAVKGKPTKLKYASPGLLKCLAGTWVSAGFDYPGYDVTGGDGATFSFHRVKKPRVIDLVWTLSYAHMTEVDLTDENTSPVTTVKLRFSGSLSGGLFQDPGDGYVESLLIDDDVHLLVSVDGSPFGPASPSDGLGSSANWSSMRCSPTSLVAGAAGDPVTWHFHRRGVETQAESIATEDTTSRGDRAQVPSSVTSTVKAAEHDPCRLVTSAQVARAARAGVGRHQLDKDLGPTPICLYPLTGTQAPNDDSVQVNDFPYNSDGPLLKGYKKVRVDGHPGLCGSSSSSPVTASTTFNLLLESPEGTTLEVTAVSTSGQSACAVDEAIARVARPKL